MTTGSMRMRKTAGIGVRRAVAAFFLGLFGTEPALAQDLPLPTPQVSVVASNQRVEVTWAEIAPNAGRRVTVDSLISWDPDSSSTFQLVGDYVGECDFRLFVQRVAEPNSFGVIPRLTVRLFDQEQAIGPPLAIDTVEVFEPNVPYPISASVAPNVSIVLGPNVNPADELGTIPVTIGGLNTNLARSSTYLVTALNAVTNFPFDSDSLVIRVAGPTTENDSTIVAPINQTVDTLVVREANQAIPILNGMTISLGSGDASVGSTSVWSARWMMNPIAVGLVNLEAYAGYHIWRSDTPNLDAFTLLGEISVCESKTEFSLPQEGEDHETISELDYDPVNRSFKFTDLDVHNDFPFRYAISTFDLGFLGNEFGLVFEGERIPSGVFYPGRSARDESQEVYVVPNPYVSRADWEQGGEAKVVFTNLPSSCTIRVFTESADHLATIVHGPDQANSTSSTTVTWNLKAASGESIVPGVYIYYVEGPSFQQTGKMMVAR